MLASIFTGILLPDVPCTGPPGFPAWACFSTCEFFFSSVLNALEIRFLFDDCWAYPYGLLGRTRNLFPHLEISN